MLKLMEEQEAGLAKRLGEKPTNSTSSHLGTMYQIIYTQVFFSSLVRNVYQQ
jgi:hypothetical protein